MAFALPLPSYSEEDIAEIDTNADNEILCPLLKTIQPDTSNGLSFIEDLITKGNAGAVLATSFYFNALVLQQGLFTTLFGGVLDLERLDEIPLVSHLDLYNSQTEAVTANLTAMADADGYVTLQDLVQIKKWVAEIQKVDPIGFISQGETVLLFLAVGGDFDENKVLATDVIKFLASEWDADNIGKTSTTLLAKGYLELDF